MVMVLDLSQPGDVIPLLEVCARVSVKARVKVKVRVKVQVMVIKARARIRVLCEGWG